MQNPGWEGSRVAMTFGCVRSGKCFGSQLFPEPVPAKATQGCSGGAASGGEPWWIYCDFSRSSLAAAQRDRLASALCWVSLGNSAGVKINKVPGSRGWRWLLEEGNSSLPLRECLCAEPLLRSGPHRPPSSTKGTCFNNLISRDSQIGGRKEMYKEREWFRQSHAGFAASIPLLWGKGTHRPISKNGNTDPSSEQRCAARGTICSNSLTLEPTAQTKSLSLISAVLAWLKKIIQGITGVSCPIMWEWLSPPFDTLQMDQQRSGELALSQCASKGKNSTRPWC